MWPPDGLEALPALALPARRLGVRQVSFNEAGLTCRDAVERSPLIVCSIDRDRIAELAQAGQRGAGRVRASQPVAAINSAMVAP